MTDKEPIIIDIDRCKYRDKYTNFCLAEKDDIGETYTICTGTDCYFKQLARKTQECEQKEKELKELKRQYKLSCLDCEYKNTKTDADRYRKALEEIEENIKSYCKNMCMAETKETCEICQNTNILNIINKAKENNG